jgi:hypothetical protein
MKRRMMIKMNDQLIEEITMLTHCDNCDSIIDTENDDYHIVDHYFNWCCECYHNAFVRCDSCKEIFPIGELTMHEYEQYCKDCYDRIKEIDE